MMADPDLGPESGLLTRLRARPAGRVGLQLLCWSVPIILLVIIGRRLSQLGWHEIWVARPGNLAFYGLLVLQFLMQPFGDYFVYRNLWGAEHTAHDGDPAQAGDEHFHAGLFRRGVSSSGRKSISNSSPAF